MSPSLKHWSWGYLTITIPPLNSASWRQLAQLYLIKLQRLSLSHLKYSSDKYLPSDSMNTFWRGGIQNLEHEFELETYELLNSSGEPGESEETIEINRALHEYPTTWTTSKLTTFLIVSPVFLHNPAIHKDTKYRNFSQQTLDLSRPVNQSHDGSGSDLVRPGLWQRWSPWYPLYNRRTYLLSLDIDIPSFTGRLSGHGGGVKN